ncbi:DNA topoisomerase I subunit omega [Salmonella enterica subsp. enterica serovar Gaminara str. ATCC BAA-711]|nr:DNA topoisomerase I subunit omega [Salmonella enterica subsp. enterica serovar Gaminara str. ATCC BAA-711]
MNYDFTAQMEDSLDQVANHQAEWKAVLDNFFSDFTQQLDKAEKDPEEGGMRPNQMVLTSIDCPTCGRKWEFVLPVRGFSLDVQVMRFRRKSVVKRPLTWCRKMKF